MTRRELIQPLPVSGIDIQTHASCTRSSQETQSKYRPRQKLLTTSFWNGTCVSNIAGPLAKKDLFSTSQERQMGFELATWLWWQDKLC